MFWIIKPKLAWKVSRPQWQQTNHGQRVSAVIGGHLIWFESSDIALTPAPEAFAQVMLIPALHQRRRLKIDSPLDAAWLANVEKVTKVFSSWWDYPASIPIDGASANNVARPHLPKRPEGCIAQMGPDPIVGRNAALCFSGGIDSFFSLLRGSAQFDNLIFVHGFDIRLDDATRMQAMASTLCQVASATGKRLIIVRTNLREHPLFRSTPWERTHGAALAAIGHLLAPEIRQLEIAASWPYPERYRWGSHWEIDPLWSASRTCIVGEITSDTRWDKLAALGGHPLVQQHLHVCWKNQTPTGNCSRCEKCVRTMVMLDATGHLNGSRVFAPAEPLADLLDALRTAPPHTTAQWLRVAGRVHSADVKHAIERLVYRSHAAISRKAI
ncbi:MAG TPA: hypothetical protein VE988_20480 [Gemmataceae bacterium]|nr:hypothetical protein [Gemmataceae bacterium]